MYLRWKTAVSKIVTSGTDDPEDKADDAGGLEATEELSGKADEEDTAGETLDIRQSQTKTTSRLFRDLQMTSVLVFRIGSINIAKISSELEKLLI